MNNASNNKTNVDAFEINDIINLGERTLIAGMPLLKIKVGQKLVNKRTGKVFTVLEIHFFRKLIEEIEANRFCGMIVSDAEKSDFERFDILQLSM